LLGISFLHAFGCSGAIIPNSASPEADASTDAYVVESPPDAGEVDARQDDARASSEGPLPFEGGPIAALQVVDLGIVRANTCSPCSQKAALRLQIRRFMGLSHTTEVRGDVAEPLPDTPRCIGISASTLGACPDMTNIMFPSGAAGNPQRGSYATLPRACLGPDRIVLLGKRHELQYKFEHSAWVVERRECVGILNPAQFALRQNLCESLCVTTREHAIFF
jgi:hypothetical protein